MEYCITDSLLVTVSIPRTDVLHFIHRIMQATDHPNADRILTRASINAAFYSNLAGTDSE